MAKTHVKDPQSDHAVEHELLGPLFEMYPHGADSEGRSSNVEVQEHFIKGMADGRRRLEENEDEGHRTLEDLLLAL